MSTRSVAWRINSNVWLRAAYHTCANSIVEEFIYKLDFHNTLKTMKKMVGAAGIEPATPASRRQCPPAELRAFSL